MAQVIEHARGEVCLNVRGTLHRADWEVRNGALNVSAEIGSCAKSLAGLERMPDTLARLLLLELVRGDAH